MTPRPQGSPGFEIGSWAMTRSKGSSLQRRTSLSRSLPMSLSVSTSLAGGFLLLLLLCVPLASGLVSVRQISRSNQRWTPLGSFGFEAGGAVEVQASALVIYSPEKASPPDTQSMGFVLAHEPEAAAWIRRQQQQQGEGGSTGGSTGGQQGDEVCPLTIPNVTRVFRVSDMGPPGAGGVRPPLVLAVPAPSPGVHTLFFLNCAGLRLVSATVEVKMWNLGPNNARLYLPTGRQYLAIVDLVLAVLFLVLLGVWLWHVLKVWCHSVPPPAYQLLLTASLPVLSALFAVLGTSLFVQQTQGASPGLHWAADCLLLLSGALLIAAFLAGLERVDAYLTDTERLILYLALPLWLAAQTALAMSQNDALFSLLLSPDSVLRAPALEQLQAASLLALALLALLLALEFLASCCSQLLLKRPRTRDDREEDSPLSKYYVKMVLCLVGTTAAAYLVRQLAPYSLQWLADALCGVAGFGFMAYTLHRVRPRLEKSVYQLFDESDDMDEELAEL